MAISALQWEGSQQRNVEALCFLVFFSSVGMVENLLLLTVQNGKRNTRIRKHYQSLQA